MTFDTVVDGGADARHRAFVVWRRMLLQICREYPSLPDPLTLTVERILFFYNDLKPELRERTKRVTQKPK